jgi:serine protease
MLRLRFSLYVLGSIAAALIVSGALGHSQGLSPWQPANISGVNRGMLAQATAVTPRTQGASRHVIRSDDRVGRGGVYQAGRVIVKFRDGVSAPSRLTALSQVSRTASMGARSPYADFDTVNIDQNEDAEATAAAFNARADVEYAQAAYRIYPLQNSFVPNDQFYPCTSANPANPKCQWNFPAIDLERAWTIQKGGSPSIIVAVVDTGVAFTSGFLSRHAFAFCSTDERSQQCLPGAGTNYPDLGVLSIPVARATDLANDASRFVAPFDFIWNTALPVDLDGHGTHVSGTLGELTNNNPSGTDRESLGLAGIAFNVRLMPVKVISADWDDIFHSPNSGTDDTLAAGIRYAADNGANVINMSIGRTGPSNCAAAPQTAGCAAPVESAIRYAVSKGCFIAIAGGNDFETGNQTEVMAEIASRVDGAVSVAAVDRNSQRAYYSNTAPWIEIAAPGGSDRTDPVGGSGLIYQQTYDIDSFVDTFTNPVAQYKAPRFDIFAFLGFEGTSMATPHVSGLAALLMSQGIKDPAAVEAAIEHFATDLGTAGRDNSFGFGEINARNTLRGLGLAR